MTTAASQRRPVGGGAAHTGAEHRHLGLALAIICTAQLMVVLDATIVNIALPSMQRALHFSPTGLEWVINAYALAFGGLLLLGGRSGDLYGRRRMFIVGIALFSVASLAGGFAIDQAWLITSRVAQGVGGAIASPTALSLIANTFAEGAPRNRAMGVYAAMSGAGAAIGLLLGGVLTDLASWRWVFFVNVPIGSVLALLAPRVLAESDTRPGRLDLPGALSVTGGMTLLVYGLARAATHGWGSLGTSGALVVAAGLLALFLVIEARSPQPLMPLRIFADRNRSGAYVIMLCLGAAVFAMFFFLTQFVQNILGYSPLAAGFAFLPVSFAIAITAGVTSRLVGRFGTRRPMTLGPLAAAGGLLWLSFLHVGSSYPTDLLPPMLLLAAGMGLSFVPLTLTAVSGVRGEDAGLASALLNTGQQIGGSLGLAVLVTVATTITSHRLRGGVAAGGAHRALEYAVAAGYSGAFRVGALIALLAFVAALTTIRVRGGEVSRGGVSGVSPG
ncbi:MAG: MFS transporter [Mycobacteriales bacterium]